MLNTNKQDNKLEMYKILQKSFLFKEISIDEIEDSLKSCHYSINKYKKGEYIAFKDDKIEYLTIVVGGVLHTEMIKENGSVTHIDTLSEGDVIAPAFLFSEKQLYPVDIKTEVNTTLISIRKNEFLNLLSQNLTLLQNFIRAISNKTEYLSNRIWRNVQYKTIKQKTIAHILKNEEKGCITIKSLEKLAGDFGVERPSLSRVLSVLVEEEKIERIGRNKYNILDIEKLYEDLGE